MKQTIEIEVPEGKKAIYKDGKIAFENIEHYKTIQTISQAVSWVNTYTDGKYEDLIQDYYNVDNDYIRKIIVLKLVYIALTKDKPQNLIEGNYYYPWLHICDLEFNTQCYTIIGTITYNNKQYRILGGRANFGSAAGLCYFDSCSGVSFAASYVAMFGFQDKDIAKYMSVQFGKLLFEVINKFQNVDWQWV